ncbi:ras-related and estrogen-regulated growth inhibitor-like [Asterias amurensis]|uniref:ras-related and estrogen-regulated growth inhibitor-like n=1 Tax=Asterias amurensis TaxID=7602 RepID=UPI003AB62609
MSLSSRTRRSTTFSAPPLPENSHSSPPPSSLSFRVVLLGSPCVGKTALMVRYVTRRFIGDYDPTLEYLCRYHASVDGEDVAMEILDTAGHDKHGHRNAYALWGDAFLFVYSVSDRRSFDEISNIKRDVENALKITSSLPVILVANKNDLRKEMRTVSESEGKKLAEDMGYPYFEISAKDGRQIWSVAELFHNVFREWKHKRSDEKHERAQRKAHGATAHVKRAMNKLMRGPRMGRTTSL